MEPARNSGNRRRPSNHCLTDAALIGAINNLSKPGNNMRSAMIAKLYHNPSAAHFVGDGAGGAGTGEESRKDRRGSCGSVALVEQFFQALAYQTSSCPQICLSFRRLRYGYFQQNRTANQVCGTTPSFTSLRNFFSTGNSAFPSLPQ